jgi:four helix bundle protein
MGYRSFEDLEVWKRACQLVVEIYGNLKDCRDFGLKDQMTRAAVSIASNIAEGAERDSKQEYIRFIHIAKGSAAELRTQLYTSQKIGVLNKGPATELVEETRQISSMLQGMVKYLRKK